MPLCNNISFPYLTKPSGETLWLIVFGLHVFVNKMSSFSPSNVKHQFCPSVANSWCGWQPVQAGSDEEYVHHNIMPEAVFEVIKPTYISLTNKALLHRCLRLVTQSQNEDFNAMIWNMWPKQGFFGAEVVELSAHLARLQLALTMELSPSWLFYAKLRDALLGASTESYVQLEDAFNNC